MFSKSFIVTNVRQSKQPWSDVPLEVLIEDERRKQKELEDNREQLRVPPPFPRGRPNKEEKKKDEEYKVVFKSS